MEGRDDNQFSMFNLNHNIWVKLDDAGYRHLANLNNANVGKYPNWEHKDAAYFKAQANEDGYTKFTAWDFIKKFGSVTTAVPFGGDEYYKAPILMEKEHQECYQRVKEIAAEIKEKQAQYAIPKIPE